MATSAVPKKTYRANRRHAFVVPIFPAARLAVDDAWQDIEIFYAERPVTAEVEMPYHVIGQNVRNKKCGPRRGNLDWLR